MHRSRSDYCKSKSAHTQRPDSRHKFALHARMENHMMCFQHLLTIDALVVLVPSPLVHMYIYNGFSVPQRDTQVADMYNQRNDNA